MVVKKLKELYPADTVSQDKGWEEIWTALQSVEGDVTIDFTNTHVVNPWNCGNFRKILKDTRISMKFTNNAEVANRIKMMCVLDGMDPDRITNEVIEKPKPKTAEEKKIEAYGKVIQNDFEIKGDTAIFDVSKQYSQLHNTTTVNYVQYAIDRLIEQGIKKFVINIGKVGVLDNVLGMFADMMVSYETQGVDLKLDIDSQEKINTLGLYLHKATAKLYTSKEKLRMLRDIKKIKPGTPGILIKYKSSRALDKFGRHGKGEVISSRIALFKGFDSNEENGDANFLVEAFSDNYFFTKQHWMVEHDNEVPTRLHSEKLSISMDELGYGDLFLGSNYHFILPIQQSKDENRIVITGLSENGSNIKQYCTIPERMKIVFDNWGIDYNSKILDFAIKETKKKLGE